MEKRTRPRQVKFWVTDEEFEKINEQAAKSKVTKQEYLLRAALNKKITVIPGLKEILIELSKEGNNLKMLSKELQKGNIDLEEINSMQKKLSDLWTSIDETLKEGRQ